MGFSTACETFKTVRAAQDEADKIIEQGLLSHPKLPWADKMQTTLPLLAARRALSSFFSGKVERALDLESRSIHQGSTERADV